MKKFVIAIFLTFLFFTLQAQRPEGSGNKSEEPSITGNISGTVVDSLSFIPVEYAIVELLSSKEGKQLNGTITDDKGQFNLKNIKTGNYKLKISFLSYNPKIIRNVELTLKDPDLNLGQIFLQPNDIMLNEVQIVDQRSVVESQIDKLVYNVSNDPTLVGGDAVDVLRKVPMLSVDMDGNVSIRGSQRVRILLNGKPSSLFSDDVGEALQMFPADEVLKVEVLTAPGAKYDAEGSAGIINIVTKKSILKGINGSVRTFFGDRMEHFNGSLAVGQGRFGINTSLGVRYKLPADSGVEFHRETFTESMLNTLDQNGSSSVSRLGFRGVLGAFYDLNAFNSFNTSIKFSGRAYNNDGIQTSVFSNPELNYVRDSKGEQSNQSYNWTTDYTRKFAGNEERKLVIAFQLEKEIENNDNEKTISTLPYTELNVNDGSNQEITALLDYTHPFGKIFKLDAGAKTILRNMNSDFNRSFLLPNNIDSLDNINTDIFNYKQNVYAAYLSGTFQLPFGVSVMPGLRFEETFLNGSYKNFDKLFENTYDNWFPSITLNKKFKDFSNVRITFNQRLSRPSINHIDPFINNQDPQNINYGNPYLYPEVSDNYEVSYSKFLKGATFNVSVYYKNTNDIIESFLFVDNNNVSNTTFYNIGSSQSYGFDLFSSLTFFKIWQIRGSFNLNKYYIDASNLNVKTENDGIRYNSSLSSNVTFKNGWQAEIWGRFNSPDYTLQGKNPSFSMYSIGVQKEILNKKAKIGIRAVSPFSKNKIFVSELSGPSFTQTNKTTVPFRSIGISFSYNFGKLDFKTRKEAINNQDQKNNQTNDDMQEN